MITVFNKGKAVLDKLSQAQNKFIQFMHNYSELVYLFTIIAILGAIAAFCITMKVLDENAEANSAKDFLASKNIVLPLSERTTRILENRIKKLESVGFETFLWKVRGTPDGGYFTVCTMTKDNETYLFMEDMGHGFTITPKSSGAPMVFIQNGVIKDIKE